MLTNKPGQRFRTRHGLAVHRDDDVLGLNTGLGRGGISTRRGDDRTLAGRAVRCSSAVLHGHAEERVLGRSGVNELRTNVLCKVRWDCKAEAD